MQVSSNNYKGRKFISSFKVSAFSQNIHTSLQDSSDWRKVTRFLLHSAFPDLRQNWCCEVYQGKLHVLGNIKVQQNNLVWEKTREDLVKLIKQELASLSIVRTHHKRMSEVSYYIQITHSTDIWINIGHLESEQSCLARKKIMEHPPQECWKGWWQARGDWERPDSLPIQFWVFGFCSAWHKFSAWFCQSVGYIFFNKNPIPNSCCHGLQVEHTFIFHFLDGCKELVIILWRLKWLDKISFSFNMPFI